MREASYKQPSNFRRENNSKPLISSTHINHTLWALDGLTVLVLVYAVFSMRISWFLPNLIIGENIVDIWVICIAVTALLSIPIFGALQNYYEYDHRPIFKNYQDFGASGNSILRILLAGFLFGFMSTIMIPHAST